MRLFIARVCWFAFWHGHKLVAEPHRVEYGVGKLVNELWRRL